jgi:hypothetical protein
LTGERYSLVLLILLSPKSLCPGALAALLPHQCFGTAPTCDPTSGTPHTHISYQQRESGVMKAVRIHTCGGREVMQVEEVREG